MGVLSVCLQWEEEGGVSNAQTKSGTNIPWFLFIYFVEQEGGQLQNITLKFIECVFLMNSL